MNVLVALRLSEQSCIVHERFRINYVQRSRPCAHSGGVKTRKRDREGGRRIFLFFFQIVAPELSPAALGEQTGYYAVWSVVLYHFVHQKANRQVIGSI